MRTAGAIVLVMNTKKLVKNFLTFHNIKELTVMMALATILAFVVLAVIMLIYGVLVIALTSLFRLF